MDRRVGVVLVEEVDERCAVGAGAQVLDLHGAAGGGLGRAAHDLDQAHAAVAGDGQAFVIAEARNFLPRHLASLQDSRALRHLEFLAVYGAFRHY